MASGYKGEGWLQDTRARDGFRVRGRGMASGYKGGGSVYMYVYMHVCVHVFAANL